MIILCSISSSETWLEKPTHARNKMSVGCNNTPCAQSHVCQEHKVKHSRMVVATTLFNSQMHHRSHKQHTQVMHLLQ